MDRLVFSVVSVSTRHLRKKLAAASFITSAAANLSMTLLIGKILKFLEKQIYLITMDAASRIYWISRKARATVSLDLARINELVILLL
jgi:hypothetical protein